MTVANLAAFGAAVLAGFILGASFELVRWLIRRRSLKLKASRGRVLDLCEKCGAPATHELGEVHESGPGGGSGMVACYCARHRPGRWALPWSNQPKAIRVR